jgi:hypothetical protein
MRPGTDTRHHRDRDRSTNRGCPRPALPGTWSAELSYPDDYGTLERRTVYGKTQAEVRASFRDARERIESGGPVKDASMAVAAWLED